MNQKGKGISLNHVYDLRKNFTVLGLTGKTGTGCSEVANQLTHGFNDGTEFENPLKIFQRFQRKSIHNAFRKHRIVYNYAKENYKPFVEIKYKHVITLFLLEQRLTKLFDFLNSSELRRNFESCGLLSSDFSDVITSFQPLLDDFERFSKIFKDVDIANIRTNGKWQKLYKLFFNGPFQEFSDKIHENLGKNSFVTQNAALNYHRLMQILCDNLRKSGNPYDIYSSNPEKIFTIVEHINILIKSHRNVLERTQIVINSLKNPLELMFFKQRYTAFYGIAVNREYEDISNEIIGKFTTSDEQSVKNILDEEYEGGKNKEFYKQKISECLQLADIHISYLTKEEAYEKNNKLFEWKTEDSHDNKPKSDVKGKHINTSPYFSWKDQLLKYVTLIDHPGIVSPSPEERCMQLAYTAKHNSGCISRHVGAAITDEEYSIKAIGWNNTPAGQVPCSLRNATDLTDPNPLRDTIAFTNYERGVDNNQSKEYEAFKSILNENFDTKVKQNSHLLKGRNVCFCFRSLKNSMSEGKNQVHTRSLHAEENAFLQLTKYGGAGIRNGILFSTASPCELCSKKAYQLGIMIIYYIDPYPGISKSHILSSGENPIEIRLFNGAIGSTYHQLYQIIMPYKDELALLLDHNIKDMASKLQDQLKRKDDENARLKAKIEELEAKSKTK